MAVDMDRVNDYSMNSEENRAAIHEQQQVNYAEDFLQRLNLDLSQYNNKDITMLNIKFGELLGDLINNDKLSQTEKVLLVSKRLCEGISYNNELLTRFDEKEINRNCSSMGALVDGKAVCSGYSEAFYQAMQLLDIPTRYVSGKQFRDGEFSLNHAWNQVQLEDGQWYNVDLTAVDADMQPGVSTLSVWSHPKFLTSDQDFSVVSKQDGERNFTPQELNISGVRLKAFEDMAYKRLIDRFGPAFEERVKSGKVDIEKLYNSDLFKAELNNAINQYGRKLYYGDNFLCALEASDGKSIEECLQSIDIPTLEQTINNVKEYENSLNLNSKKTEPAKKIGAFQKIKNFIKKDKNQPLALPESNKTLENQVEGSVTSTKVNDFRESLKVPKEQLNPIEKNEIEDNQIQKDDFER